jgi:UDP-3-O-[3-hydroxymyristoyl] glucosamine N-acyltransferase
MGTQDKKMNFMQKIGESDGDWFADDMEEGAIEVGERCFIGINTVLLPGTQLGKACVVGANTVVKGVYDDYSIIACDTSGNFVSNLSNLANWEE